MPRSFDIWSSHADAIELHVLQAILSVLKQRREQVVMSLGDPFPNPTLHTIIRIADALGVQVTVGLQPSASA